MKDFRRFAGALACAAAILVGVSGGCAWAHPFGNRVAGQQLEVTVTAAGVRVALVSEVPDALLAQISSRADDRLADALQRLASGIVVEVDGAELPLTVEASQARRDPVDDHGHLLSVSGAVDRPLLGRHTVRVGHAGLDPQATYHRVVVLLGPTVSVPSTSLRASRSDPPWLDRRWLRLDGLRRVELTVDVPDGPWSIAYRWIDPRTADLREAWARTWGHRWRSGRQDPTVVAVALGLSLALGAGAARTVRSGALAVAGGAVIAILAQVTRAHPAPGLVAVAIAAVALLGARDATLGRTAPWVAMAWPVLAVDGPWRAPAVAAFAVGLALGSRLAPSTRLVLFGVASVVASGRGAP